MSIQELALGFWQQTGAENLNEYMKALGVKGPKRFLISKISPGHRITIDDDGQWTFATVSKLKNYDIKFKLNEPFEEKTGDGRTCKTTFTAEGNKLMQVQEAEITTTVERIFTKDTMETIFKVNDVVAKKSFKKKE